LVGVGVITRVPSDDGFDGVGEIRFLHIKMIPLAPRALWAERDVVRANF
jgi:hypothetical protein